jgi:23S rRNA (uracil1939-C5)-methyltransferase
MVKPRFGQKINLTMQNFGLSGEGVGKWHGYTVFVDGAIPEEVIKARIVEKHKSYGRAKIETIITPSLNRVQPICPLFLQCGGCSLMHLAYEQQLAFKTSLVKNSFRSLNLDDMVLDCAPSCKQYGYRNKVILPAKEEHEAVCFGFYSKGSKDIVPMNKCYLHVDLLEQVIEVVKRKIVSFDFKNTLRHLVLKCGVHTNEVLLIFITKNRDVDLQDLAENVVKACPNIKGVLQNVNANDDNIVFSDEFYLLYGNDYIEEIISSMRFKFGKTSFFQVNPYQAEKIYDYAINVASLNENDTVLDAYCGVGIISLLAAKKCRKILGVENVQEAVEFAKFNAKLNHITNAEFYCHNAEDFIVQIPHLNVVFLNPPRQGCDINLIDKLKSDKIVYISCNPLSLARDVSLFLARGYVVKSIKPFDMFPQTAHVETVAVLQKQL